jgi:hypothetical protein
MFDAAASGDMGVDGFRLDAIGTIMNDQTYHHPVPFGLAESRLAGSRSNSDEHKRAFITGSRCSSTRLDSLACIR